MHRLPHRPEESPLEILKRPLDPDLISYLALLAHNVVECDDQAQSPPLPTLQEFIRRLVLKSKVPVPTLMSSLVYIRRLKSRVPPGYRGTRSIPHRIILACLILAAKYLHDAPPSNKAWAAWTMATKQRHFGFTMHEINTMERYLLALLQWDAHISEEDLERELHLFLSFKARQEYFIPTHTILSDGTPLRRERQGDI
jgi:PHO85 cyclin-1